MPQRYYKSSLVKLHTSWATQTQFCYEWFYTVKSKLFNHLFWMTNLGKTAFYYTSMQLLAWFCILVFVHYSSILTESKQQNYPLSHPLHWDIWQNAVSLPPSVCTLSNRYFFISWQCTQITLAKDFNYYMNIY